MRFLLVAAAGLGFSIAGAGLMLERGPPSRDRPGLACPVLGARIGSADRLEVTHGGEVLWLERRGAVWGLARQGGYPARPGQAEALVATLTGLRLLKPDPAAPDSLGLADPMQPGPRSGYAIRILGTSGATLCAIVAGPNPAVRRPGEPGAWTVAAPVPVPGNAEAWTQRTLPSLDPATIVAVADAGGLDPATVPALLTSVPITDIRPRPQAHLTPVRTVGLTLGDGTATITVGMEGGQAWLGVAGTAAWARPLAGYVFALPPGNALAAP